MIKKVLLFIAVLFITIINVQAEEFIGHVTGENVGFRSCPEASSKCPRLYDLFLTRGHTVTMTTKELTPGSGCSAGWYKGTYNNVEGYICSQYIEFKVEIIPKNPEDYATYKEYLIGLGFPESYIEKLSALNDKYPKWDFTPVLTGIDFATAVNAQSTSGKSCTYSTNQGYYLTDSSNYNYETDTFKSVDAGCYATNPETTAYYLDARNWLDERNIMMFEDLSFNAENQTLAAVTSILAGNQNLSMYSNEFYNAHSQVINNETKTISPVHLASRSRIEIGNGTAAGNRVNGKYTTNTGYTYNGLNLDGYYNFYNIGAYGSAKIPSARGMAYACGTRCGITKDGSNELPWNTAQKGIHGGAQFIINRYFLRGQDTIYFQKFNTSGVTTPFTNQYMQNIAAPSSEGKMTYNAYNKNNLVGNKIKFKIPVYLNMPNTCNLPPSGNPNNRLKELLVNDKLVENFKFDNNEYTVNLPINATNINLKATPINSKANVNNTGDLPVNKTMKEIIVKVTAENLSVYEYKIKLNFIDPEVIILTPEETLNNSNLKNDGNYILDILEGQDPKQIIEQVAKANLSAGVVIKNNKGEVKKEAIVTGDILSITSNKVTKDYTMVVLGDGSGDGIVSIVDLLRVQKHILNASNLTGAYLKAIDIDKDNKITIVDLLKIQKHILGITKIGG